jgi:hypothetical protein
MSRNLPACLAAASALLATGALRADVLVTRQGDQITTAGPWRVQGRMVVFTLPGGALSSMRADQVDLDRSAVATERAAQVQVAQAVRPVEPARPAEPVFRITDEDVTPAPPAPAEDEEAVEGSEDVVEDEAGNRGPASTGPLEVISWDQVDMAEGDGLEIFGTIRNNGRSLVSAPAVTVMVYGERGGLLATSDGSVNQPAISPGNTANFRALLPGLVDFTAIKFDLRGRGYSVRDDGGTAERGAGESEATEQEEDEVDEEELDPGAKYDSMVDDSGYLAPEESPEETADDEPADESAGQDTDEYAEEPPPVD